MIKALWYFFVCVGFAVVFGFVVLIFLPRTILLSLRPTTTLPVVSTVKITGSIKLTDDLKKGITPDKGILVFWLSRAGDTAATVPRSRPAYQHMSPTFPFALNLSFIKDERSADTSYFLRARYCPDEELSDNCEWLETLPQLVGRSASFTISKSGNEVVELGDLPLTHRITLAKNASCLPGHELLSGTVQPTPAFLQRFGKKQIALVVAEAPELKGFVELSDSEKARKGAEAKAVPLDFSSGKATFAIPRGNESKGYWLKVYGVDCTGKNVTDCAAIPEGPDTLPVIAENYVLPYCGMQNLKFFIHGVGAKPLPLALPDQSGANLTPPERVEGATL